MGYVDGFLIPVPNGRKDEYRAHEEKWWPWFRDKGATGLVITWGDDVLTVLMATLVLDAEAEVVGVDPLLLCPTGAVPQNPSLQLSSVPQSLSPLQGCPSRNLPLKQAPSASAPTK